MAPGAQRSGVRQSEASGAQGRRAGAGQSDAHAAEASALSETLYEQCFEALEAGRSEPRMLDLQLRSGDRWALPYAYLRMIQYRRSEGLRLSFADCEVQVKGRNLDEIYLGLLANRVLWIAESPPLDCAPDEAVVTALRVVEESGS